MREKDQEREPALTALVNSCQDVASSGGPTGSHQETRIQNLPPPPDPPPPFPTTKINLPSHSLIEKSFSQVLAGSSSSSGVINPKKSFLPPCVFPAATSPPDMDLDSHLFIPISEAKYKELSEPWALAVIIKVVGKSLSKDFLAGELRKIWSLQRAPNLIALGRGFYTLKCETLEGKTNLLSNGPWMIQNYHLWIQNWTPGFRPSKNIPKVGAAWANLHELPVEFFEESMLELIGKAMGTLLRVDSATLQGEGRRYARICILTEEGSIPPKGIWLGGFFQPIEFLEGPWYCAKCGVFGHSDRNQTIHPAPVTENSKQLDEGWVQKRGKTKERDISVGESQRFKGPQNLRWTPKKGNLVSNLSKNPEKPASLVATPYEPKLSNHPEKSMVFHQNVFAALQIDEEDIPVTSHVSTNEKPKHTVPSPDIQNSLLVQPPQEAYLSHSQPSENIIEQGKNVSNVSPPNDSPTSHKERSHTSTSLTLLDRKFPLRLTHSVPPTPGSRRVEIPLGSEQTNATTSPGSQSARGVLSKAGGRNVGRVDLCGSQEYDAGTEKSRHPESTNVPQRYDCSSPPTPITRRITPAISPVVGPLVGVKERGRSRGRRAGASSQPRTLDGSSTFHPTKKDQVPAQVRNNRVDVDKQHQCHNRDGNYAYAETDALHDQLGRGKRKKTPKILDYEGATNAHEMDVPHDRRISKSVEGERDRGHNGSQKEATLTL